MMHHHTVLWTRIARLGCALGLMLVATMALAPVTAEARPQQGRVSASATGSTVYFNTNSHKYHRMSCIWAVRCTRNCIAIPRAKAIQRGGVPCKVCGGR